MAEYLQNLPDGWTIYVWLVVAAVILLVAAYFIRWAAKNEQFDEDVKYVIFDKNDQDKMEPEEYNKAMEVIAHQEERRKFHLQQQAQEAAAARHEKG